MSRRVSFSNFLEESKRRRRRESSLEETSIFASLVTQLLQNLSSLSIFAPSCQELSTLVERLQVLQVSLLVSSRTQKLETSVSRQELSCLLITESAALMNSTKWTSKIRLLSMRQWNNKPFLSPRLESMQPLTLELQFWQQPILNWVDTTRTGLWDSMSTSLLQSCLVLTFSSSFSMRRTMMKIIKSPSTLSTCTGWKMRLAPQTSKWSRFRLTSSSAELSTHSSPRSQLRSSKRSTKPSDRDRRPRTRLLTKWLLDSSSHSSDSPRPWPELTATTGWDQPMWRRFADFSETVTSTSRRTTLNSKTSKRKSTDNFMRRDKSSLLRMLLRLQSKLLNQLPERSRSVSMSIRDSLWWLWLWWRSSSQISKRMCSKQKSSTEWSRN